ncbi:MAG: hypothetical protein AAGA30_04285 [Planctomycetota bacterium]
MTNLFFDSKHNDSTRRENLYRGAIYVFSPTKFGAELCEFARNFCKEKFHPHHPPLAHQSIEVDDYVGILKQLKPEFIHHPRCKELLSGLLAELGCGGDDTYFDVPRIRTACPAEYLSSGMAYAFKPHRDSWYSTPMCQLNWWLPVFPVTEDNCMTFHLNYWNRPLRNSSAGFNYQDWNQVGRKQAHRQGKKDRRVQSEALEDVELNPQIRIVAEPGSVIVFSAAHLHSTVPNSTDLTRISIDFRTVNLVDLKNSHGAPNYDGESTGTTTGDYLRCDDHSHLPEDVIANYRDLKPAPLYPNEFSSTKSSL